MDRNDLIARGPCVFEIPVDRRSDMHVPARIYADDALLDAMMEHDAGALTQLMNVATLPGVVECVYGMPDMHEGYGFPVGGVAATAAPDGVISPGGVGFDINCGVRLLALPIELPRVHAKIESFVHEISRTIPSGTGRGGRWSMRDEEFDRVLTEGARFLVESRGHGFAEDVLHTEANGCLDGADASRVSRRARERGRDQLGTIGSGNHFIEVQTVDEVFDGDAAAVMGLGALQITVLIHTGSRGFGHQICTDSVQRMDDLLARQGISLVDRQLSCAPLSSDAGRDYFAAMACAANFAWSNRQLIADMIRQIAVRIFNGLRPEQVRVVYDVAHNIAKVEQHEGRLLCVHRKGATRAFGPAHLDLPEEYRAIGQPVFIPGSMGTASYVLAGGSASESLSWGSACHGAGRRLSRTAAKKIVTGAQLRRELEAKGIVVRCPSASGLAEEAPIAYKDVERVTEVVETVGIARRVARLRPIGVVKG